mmetsp:Transcript_101703/g.242548  ORF Transcript_101703/g.242548 Transcript_101703/m.242548 type:complete len:396 (+) Transcript_101703:30-1217(+)
MKKSHVHTSMTEPPRPSDTLESRTGSRSGAKSLVYRSKYKACFTSSANSRGSFSPFSSATRTTSKSKSVTCSLSRATSATTFSGPLPRKTTSDSSPAIRAKTLATSSAKAVSSTVPVAPMAIRLRAMPRASPAANDATRPSTANQISDGILPTMPKSRKPTRPSSSTRRFPACTSAWKISQPRTDIDHTFSALMRVCSGLELYWRIPSRSVRGTPLNSSMVSTLLEEASGIVLGAAAMRSRPFRCRKLRKVSMFSNSFVKSNSSSMLDRISATMSTSELRASSGLRNSSVRAAMKRKPRSAFRICPTPGFCTFTATRSPLRSTAAWTWATEAEASGVSSKDAKTRPSGSPRSASTTRRMARKPTGSVASKQRWNSRTYAAGNNVGEDAMNWPSLT